MMKRFGVPFVLAGLLLNGCSPSSGGGNAPTIVGGTSPTPTPAPAPAPTPTPSPSPAPTPAPTPTPPPSSGYTPFAALTGDQRYASACTGYYAPTAMTPVPAQTPASPFQRDGLILYTAATQTYTVNTPQAFSETFGPASLVANPPANTIAYRKQTSFGETQQFSIFRPSPGGFALDYARTTNSDFRTSTTTARATNLCVIGVPTRTDDIPPVPFVSFTRGTVSGIAFDARSGSTVTYSLGNSTVTMTVDLTNGSFTSVLRLVGTPTAGGADVVFGTYTVTGGLDPNSAGFFGSDPTLPPGLTTSVRGGFFGPQGAEYGYVFELLGRTSATPVVSNLLVLGTVAGAR